MSVQGTLAPVLSVVGNSGVKVERVDPDEHNKQITVWVDEHDALVRNAAQRLAQKVAPPGWTVRVDAMRERRAPIVLGQNVEPVSSRVAHDVEHVSGEKRLGVLRMLDGESEGEK